MDDRTKGKFAVSQGVRIFWDEAGTGEPLLLIMGLGFSSDAWFRSIPVFSRRYRTIFFDNRGVGRSDPPPGPYTIAALAADAVAVLDDAGVARAHLFGISMGGMIAQELAVRYPQRVRSLILGGTTAGGIFGPEAAKALQWNGTPSAEEAAQAALAFVYHPATPRSRLEEDLRVRRPWFPTPAGYNAQLQAVLDWDGRGQLSQIHTPTLVIHGQDDLVFPVSSGRLLAQQIAGARLVVLPQAGHLFTTDQPEAAHRAILEFLAANEKMPAKGGR
jgi:pimeloyl-ACP methyl ester carboxylesterase